MIHAERGRVKIAGENFDILFEFNNIVNMLLKSSPELYIASVEAWSNDITTMLPKVDPQILDIASTLTRELVPDLKGELNA